ncbi:MAG TPA: exonuclease SbcCD subunit D [Nocardioidaceae bacterium]|nr:exonuclease SbcCD subunit D [Nocardioidaceae bacterium]
MRILHTSDWHLGRSFHREDLLSAQGAFIDHLVETVRHERVDVVLVSGDVFDRALPPVDAVQLASDALRRLADARARVVVTSGNHDSVHRLGFAAELIDSAGIHLRTQPAGVGAPILVEADDVPLAVYGIPYLEPDAVREPWRLAERTHTAALTEAMRRIGCDLQSRPSDTRSVVLAHAFVTGGEPSDSERDISVGGVSSVPMSVFGGADYVALGHLHGRQILADSVRYSGSPLAYSFSEARQHKGCWIIDLDTTGVRSVEFVPAPVPRRLGVLRGRLADLLSDPAHAGVEDHWLQVTLTDRRRPDEAMRRLRTRFPYALVLGFEPDRGDVEATGPVERVRGRSDLQIAAAFVADVRGEPPTADEHALLVHACDAWRTTEVR